MAGFNQVRRRLGNAALHCRIERTFVFNGRLDARGITVTDQRPAVGTNGNALLFQKGQIVTDRDRRDAIKLRKIVNLYASLLP
ncbi:hypothetical protein D3C86_1823510 [compost metagenome]